MDSLSHYIHIVAVADAVNVAEDEVENGGVADVMIAVEAEEKYFQDYLMRMVTMEREDVVIKKLQ